MLSSDMTWYDVMFPEYWEFREHTEFQWQMFAKLVFLTFNSGSHHHGPLSKSWKSAAIFKMFYVKKITAAIEARVSTSLPPLYLLLFSQVFLCPVKTVPSAAWAETCSGVLSQRCLLCSLPWGGGLCLLLRQRSAYKGRMEWFLFDNKTQKLPAHIKMHHRVWERGRGRISIGWMSPTLKWELSPHRFSISKTSSTLSSEWQCSYRSDGRGTIHGPECSWHC